MSDIKLPEITEVQRLEIRPGDRIVVKTEMRISQHEGQMVSQKVRVILKLDDSNPVIVLDHGMSLEVLSEAPRCTSCQRVAGMPTAPCIDCPDYR